VSSQVTAAYLNRLTSTIISASIQVHKELGPGLLETAYLGCLVFELRSAGLDIEIQKPLSLTYRGVLIDCAYRADIVVEGRVWSK
jgi:GxxExxY protein